MSSNSLSDSFHANDPQPNHHHHHHHHHHNVHNHLLMHWLNIMNQPHIKMKKEPLSHHKHVHNRNSHNAHNLKSPHTLLQHLHRMLFETHLLSFLVFLYISSIFALCASSSSTPPASMDDINELINSGSGGELCDSMTNCVYLTNRTPFLECASDQVCLLICDDETPCEKIDVHSDENSVLIIDCIDSKSCNELAVHAQDAYFVYMEGNDEYSIYQSQVQCPINSNAFNTNTSCVIHGNCIDIDGSSHCRQTFSTPIISKLSIYSLGGFGDLTLKCDQDDTDNVLTGAWCFDDNNFIVCGAVSDGTQQTCWIYYDDDYDRYICDGDDIDNNQLKCNNDNNNYSTTSSASSDDETPQEEEVSATSFSGFLANLSSHKQFTLYLVVTISTLLCCCCLSFLLLCTYWRKSRGANKNNNHHKLSFDTAKETCCCCYFVCNGLRRTSCDAAYEEDTGTGVDIDRERVPHTQIITVTTNAHDPIAVNCKPSLHSYFINVNQTSNSAMISPDPSISNPNDTNNNNNNNNHNNNIAATLNNLHPIKYITPQLHKHQLMQIETAITAVSTKMINDHATKSKHVSQASGSATATVTGSASNVTNTTQMTDVGGSSSHLDGLEAEAAKKLFDAKLGNKAKIVDEFDFADVSCADAFGVVVPQNMDDDLKLAIALQQEQLLFAVQGHKTMKSLQSSSSSHTPYYDNNNNNGTKQETATATAAAPTTVAVAVTTTTAAAGVLDIGGGFKIGTMADESSSDAPHESRDSEDDSYCSDSSTSTEFDPEYPNHVRYDEQSSD